MDLDLDLDLFHSKMGQYKNAIKLANGAHVRSSRANRGAGPRVYILFNWLIDLVESWILVAKKLRFSFMMTKCVCCKTNNL